MMKKNKSNNKLNAVMILIAAALVFAWVKRKEVSSIVSTVTKSSQTSKDQTETVEVEVIDKKTGKKTKVKRLKAKKLDVDICGQNDERSICASWRIPKLGVEGDPGIGFTKNAIIVMVDAEGYLEEANRTLGFPKDPDKTLLAKLAVTHLIINTSDLSHPDYKTKGIVIQLMSMKDKKRFPHSRFLMGPGMLKDIKSSFAKMSEKYSKNRKPEEFKKLDEFFALIGRWY